MQYIADWLTRQNALRGGQIRLSRQQFINQTERLPRRPRVNPNDGSHCPANQSSPDADSRHGRAVDACRYCAA